MSRFLYLEYTICMKDVENFKHTLLEERDQLRIELDELGDINPEVPGDWQTKPEDLNVDTADDIEIADSIESFEERNAIQNQLENRLIDVERALEKIATHTYGICEVCGGEIEHERLKANPAARTDITHKETNIS